jgi:hypothetical protein
MTKEASNASDDPGIEFQGARAPLEEPAGEKPKSKAAPRKTEREVRKEVLATVRAEREASNASHSAEEDAGAPQEHGDDHDSRAAEIAEQRAREREADDRRVVELVCEAFCRRGGKGAVLINDARDVVNALRKNRLI